jgi:hypothetical protein
VKSGGAVSKRDGRQTSDHDAGFADAWLLFRLFRLMGAQPVLSPM